jgi:hypothetical protein
VQRCLPGKIRAPHKGKFSLDMIEHPIAFFQKLSGYFFHLRKCVKVQSQVNTPPTLPTQGQYVMNGALLLLPARIRKGFCDGSLRKIKRIGKTERHEIAGKTSKISAPFVKKRFHLTWDIDRVPYCFHGKFLPCPIDFVKKSIQRATLPEVGRARQQNNRDSPRAVLISNFFLTMALNIVYPAGYQ